MANLKDSTIQGKLTVDQVATITGSATINNNTVFHAGNYDKTQYSYFLGDTGYTGSKGTTGNAGPTGYTGSKGPTGNPGATGAIGDKGPTGNPGATGAIGDKGPTGNPGATGATGDMGATGATGAAGPTGPQGPTGNRGATGAVGQRGPTGAEGPRGVLGSTGGTGPTGNRGATGAEGPTGFKGSRGDDGPTGFTGSIGFTGSLVNTTSSLVTLTDGLILNSANLHPAGTNNTQNIGIQNTNRYDNVFIRDTYRNSEGIHSTIKTKKDVEKVSSPLFNLDGKFLKDYNISNNENVFNKLTYLFSKLNFYKFNYKENHMGETHIGVIVEEIEDILSDSPEIADLFVSVDYEPINNESGLPTGEIKEIKHLRIDNFDTLRTLVMQNLYYEILELEKKNELIENYINDNK
jgi:hypothetical protein